MSQTALSILVGLIAGAGGALAVSLATGGGAESTAPIGVEGTDLSGITARLDRIEEALGKRNLESAPSLRGTDAPATEVAGADQLDALVGKLEERLRPTLQESVKTSVEEALEENRLEAPTIELGDGKKKRKVTMAELSSELNLTQAEEDAIRRISEESSEEFLKLLADENQSVDDIKREFESAKDNPAR